MKSVLEHCAILEGIIEQVNKLEDDVLELLTMYRDKDGNVCHIINGRPFNYQDAEHWLCKLYVVVKYTTPQYSVGGRVRSSKPHCAPFKVSKDTWDPGDCLTKLDQRTIEQFHKCVNVSQKITLPEVCQYKGEGWKPMTAAAC